MPESLWVLDTSVAASWFFTEEPLREESLAVRADLGQHPYRYIVPHLFHAEFVHVLACKSARDTKFVADALRLILRLGIRTLALTEAALLRTAEWTGRGLSGYDATFVALAEDLEGRWLTADQGAAKVAGRVHALSLASWGRRKS